MRILILLLATTLITSCDYVDDNQGGIPSEHDRIQKIVADWPLQNFPNETWEVPISLRLPINSSISPDPEGILIGFDVDENMWFSFHFGPYASDPHTPPRGSLRDPKCEGNKIQPYIFDSVLLNDFDFIIEKVLMQCSKRPVYLLYFNDSSYFIRGSVTSSLFETTLLEEIVRRARVHTFNK